MVSPVRYLRLSSLAATQLRHCLITFEQDLVRSVQHCVRKNADVVVDLQSTGLGLERCSSVPYQTKEIVDDRRKKKHVSRQLDLRA